MALEIQQLVWAHLRVLPPVLAGQVCWILSSVELGLAYSTALEEPVWLKPYCSRSPYWQLWVMMVLEVLPQQVLANSV